MAHPNDNRFLVRAIIASQFAPPFMFSGVAVALPTMGADLHAGATSLGLVETLFLGGNVAFLLPMGRLADASDKRTLYKLGLLLFGITSILIAVLSSMPAILCIRFLQGVAAATLGATAAAILADIVPPEQRGKAYGNLIGAVYTGLTLGPIIAGLLIDAWGWRAVFWSGATALLCGLLLVHAMMSSSWRRPTTAAVHIPSALLIATAVLCLIAGSALLSHGPIGYACLGGGVVLAALFVILQRRLPRPLLDVDALVRNSVLASALLVQLMLYVTAYCSIFMLSIYIQVSLGHSAKTSGQILAIGTVLMALMAPVAGLLSDRYPPRTITIFGVSSALVSGLIALSFDAETSLWLIAVMLAFQGLGFAFFSSPNMTIIMNSVPSTATSMASALSAKARSLGMISGMLITGVLISLTIGNEPVAAHPIQFIETMRTAFTVLVGVTAAALIICFVTRASRSTGAADQPGL